MMVDQNYEELALINSNLRDEYQQLSADYSSLKELMESCVKPVESLAKRLFPIKSEVLNLNNSLNGINRTIFEISKNISEHLLQNFTQPNMKSNKSLDGLFAMVGNFLTGQRASGGNVAAGNSYLVGENGPEIFRPSASGSIERNGRLSSNNPINLVMNIKTPDSNSFRKNQNQFIAEAALMLQKAVRNL